MFSSSHLALLMLLIFLFFCFIKIYKFFILQSQSILFRAFCSAKCHANFLLALIFYLLPLLNFIKTKNREKSRESLKIFLIILWFYRNLFCSLKSIFQALKSLWKMRQIFLFSRQERFSSFPSYCKDFLEHFLKTRSFQI